MEPKILAKSSAAIDPRVVKRWRYRDWHRIISDKYLGADNSHSRWSFGHVDILEWDDDAIDWGGFENNTPVLMTQAVLAVDQLWRDRNNVFRITSVGNGFGWSVLVNCEASKYNGWTYHATMIRSADGIFADGFIPKPKAATPAAEPVAPVVEAKVESVAVKEKAIKRREPARFEDGDEEYFRSGFGSSWGPATWARELSKVSLIPDPPRRSKLDASIRAAELRAGHVRRGFWLPGE